MSEIPKVDHADRVDHADQVGAADHVALAETLEIHTDGGHKSRVEAIRGLTKNIIVLIALFVVIFNYADKSRGDRAAARERAALKSQLQAVNDKLAENDQSAIDQLNCARRFQDNVDRASTETLVTIGELVVVITQIVPGPDREAAVGEKITQLQAATAESRQAVADKSAWNDALNPLPCPIS